MQTMLYLTGSCKAVLALQFKKDTNWEVLNIELEKDPF